MIVVDFRSQKRPIHFVLGVLDQRLQRCFEIEHALEQIVSLGALLFFLFALSPPTGITFARSTINFARSAITFVRSAIALLVA